MTDKNSTLSKRLKGTTLGREKSIFSYSKVKGEENVTRVSFVGDNGQTKSVLIETFSEEQIALFQRAASMMESIREKREEIERDILSYVPTVD